MSPRVPTVVTLVASAIGLFFSAWSTSDFVQHLDRQVHSIHCSFVPGLEAAEAGSSGCQVALMSPYSSVFRHAVWGGLPVSLPGMAVFAYLAYRAIERLVNRREADRHSADFLVAAWLLPVLTSIAFGYLAIVELDTFCKTCAGIYGASFLGFAGAVWNRLGLPAAVAEEGEVVAAAAVPWGKHIAGFGEGVIFVAVPIAAYFVMAPDFDRFVGGCGELVKPDDPNGVMVPVGPQQGKAAIEVLDPLCPACAGFEERLTSSGLGERLARKAVLFPLDDSCNWMVGSAIHPGACTVSEAVLCAGDQAEDVLAWAFAHGDEIRSQSAADPAAAARLVTAAFPGVASCLGTPEIKNKLNKSLRWIVANQLPILTPQLYVDGVKLCDDDTDLGMEWALSRLLDRGAAGRTE